MNWVLDSVPTNNNNNKKENKLHGNFAATPNASGYLLSRLIAQKLMNIHRFLSNPNFHPNENLPTGAILCSSTNSNSNRQEKRKKKTRHRFLGIWCDGLVFLHGCESIASKLHVHLYLKMKMNENKMKKSLSSWFSCKIQAHHEHCYIASNLRGMRVSVCVCMDS